MFRKALIVAAFLFTPFLVSACTSDLGRQTRAEIERVNQFLATHMHNEAFIEEFRDYAGERKGVWRAQREAFERLDTELRLRVVEAQTSPMERAILALVSTDAEVRQYLEGDPEKLRAYLEIWEELSGQADFFAEAK